MVKLWVGLLVVTTFLGLLLLGSQGSAQGVTVLTGTVTIDGAPAPQFTVVQAALADGTIVGTGATGLSGLSAGQYRIDVQVSSAMDGQQVNFSVQGATVSPAATAILRRNRVIRVDIAATTEAPVATATATAIPPTATPVATATPRPTARQGSAQGATVLTGTVTIDGAPAPQFTVVQAALADGTIVGTSATGLSGFSAGQYRIEVQVSPAIDGQQVTFSVQGATVSPAVAAILRSNRVVLVDIAASTGAPVATATATPRPTATQRSAQGAAVLTGTVTIDGAPAPQFTVVQAALADGTIVGTSATGLSGFSAGQYRIDIQVSPALDGQQVTFSVQGATVSPAVTAILRSNRVIAVDIAASTGAPVATATAAPRPTATQGFAQGATVLTGTVTIDGAPAPQFTVVRAALADGTIVGTGATGLSGFSAGQYRIDVQVSPALDGQQVTFLVHGATVSPAVSAILRSNRVIAVDIATSTGAPVATATATPQPAVTPGPTATPRPTARQGASQGVAVLTGTVTIDGAPAPQSTVVQAALADGTIVGTSATGLPGFSAGQYRIDVQVSPAVDGQQLTFSVQGALVSPAVTATLRSHRVVLVDIAASTGAPVATATATPRPTATPQPTVTPEPTAAPRPTATSQPGCDTGTDGYAPAHIDPALYEYLRIGGPSSNGDLGGYWREDCNAALRPAGTVDAGWLAIGLIAPGLFLGRSRFGRHK